MPQLIRNIEGTVHENIVGEVNLFSSSIITQFQQEDYISINGFTAYLQNLTQTPDTYLLSKPANFGLRNRLNIEIITLDINY